MLIGTSALGLLSAVAAFAWLGLIGLLHFVKPELDPRTRTISEYARGSHGWIMQLAFFCMAVSCWVLAMATWRLLPIVGPMLLIVCGAGFVGAGVFVTDSVLPLEPTQTRSGALHILLAFAVMLIFPIMATFVSWNIAAGAVGTTSRAWLLALSAVTWAGLLSFVVSTVRSVGQTGAPIGYSERFLVVTYTAWLAAMALQMVR